MWFDEAVVYQIYPLGLCGVLNEERSSDDSVVGHSILEVKDWISHIKMLFMRPVLKSYLTVYLIMLAAVSGHLRMCRKRNGTAHIVDGFI